MNMSNPVFDAEMILIARTMEVLDPMSHRQIMRILKYLLDRYENEHDETGI